MESTPQTVSESRRAHAVVWVVLSLLASAVALLGLTTACGVQGDVSHPQPDFPLIEPETIEIHYDDQDLSDSRQFDEMVEEDEQGLTFEEAGTLEQGLVGEDARTLGPMREALLAGNNMLKSAIVLMRRTAAEGTFESLGDGRGRWVAETLHSVIVLTVERQEGASEGQRYGYVVTVRPRSAPEVATQTLLAGIFDFVGRDEATGRQLGGGRLRYNYDAVPRTASVRREQGRGEVAFRVTSEGKAMAFFFRGFVRRGQDEPTHGRYSFVRGRDGRGLFRFFIEGDFAEELEGRERLRQAAVWDPTGAARSHTVVISAQLPQPPVIEECWGPDRKQVWLSSTPELMDFPSDGDEADCAFSAAPMLPEDTLPAEDEEPDVPSLP